MFIPSFIKNKRGKGECYITTVHNWTTLNVVRLIGLNILRAKAIGKTAHIVMRHPLETNTDHGVTAFIGSKLFTLSSKRKSNITKMIMAKHITYVTEGTNMIDVWFSIPHPICEDRAAKQVKVRMDLENVPLEGPADTLLQMDAVTGQRTQEKAT